MERENPGELFDLAAFLEKEDRAAFVALIEKAEPDLGRKLKARLKRFETFREGMEQNAGLSDIIAQVEDQTTKTGQVETESATSPRDRSQSGLPDAIGPYLIEREIARGGQGVVYLARQESIERLVALKVIYQSPFSRNHDPSRFKREMKALAMMNHDHIASIYEAGTTREGTPYFSMEYVEGRNIQRYCEENRLPMKQRLYLFLQVCEGMTHAHQRLVLHRDLKPGNVLIAENGPEPSVKIVDFGIARGLEDETGLTEGLTQMGVVGTPGYIAPELFNQAEPDTRVDIYALGAMLYLLTTGEPSLQPPEHLSLDEKWRYFREHEPFRPSKHRPGEIDPDLDAVILKAMAKDPNRRYPSVRDLARDCRLYLENRPVIARPPGRFYAYRKWIARNKMLATATTLIALSLITGLVGTLWSQQQAQKERRRFEASFTYLENILSSPDPYAMGAGARVIDVLRAGEAAFDDTLTADSELEFMLRDVWGRTYLGLGFYEDAIGHLDASITLMQDEYGENHPGALEARRLRAIALMKKGDYGQAEEELDQLYNRLPQHGLEEERLRVLISLADVYQSQKEPERAKPLLEEMEAQLGETGNTQAKARGLFSLANIHHGLGNDEAEPLYREALSLLGNGADNHPLAQSILGSLANHLRLRDRLEESEEMYRRLLEKRIETRGEGHFQTQHAKAALALCLADQRRYAEAEDLIAGVAASLSRQNANHPETLVMIRRMAKVSRDSGDIERAAELLAELVAHYRDNDLSRSPDALIARSNLGDILIERGEHREAVGILQETIRDLKEVRGDSHLSTVAAMVTLGQAREGLEEREIAEDIYREAVGRLANRQSVKRYFHYYNAIRANNLSAMEYYDEAERILFASLAGVNPGGYIHHEVRKMLASHYRNRGDVQKAAEYENSHKQ